MSDLVTYFYSTYAPSRTLEVPSEPLPSMRQRSNDESLHHIAMQCFSWAKEALVLLGSLAVAAAACRGACFLPPFAALGFAVDWLLPGDVDYACEEITRFLWADSWKSCFVHWGITGVICFLHLPKTLASGAFCSGVKLRRFSLQILKWTKELAERVNTR